MKVGKRFGVNVFVLVVSILISGIETLSAETNEPGPFERLFRSIRHGFSEPRRKSTTHRSSRKEQSAGTQASPSPSAPSPGANTPTTPNGTTKPPTDLNTRKTTRANTKKGEDLPYGTPVPGRPGLVTSPYSPNSGYIDVRGFAPGTPVKDPYTDKIFLTP